jgi:hypothetical protein
LKNHLDKRALYTVYLTEVIRNEIFEDGSFGGTEIMEYEISYLPAGTSIDDISDMRNGINLRLGENGLIQINYLLSE